MCHLHPALFSLLPVWHKHGKKRVEIYTADIREGVAIEYVSCEPSDSLKELFLEEYNADVDSFKEEEMEQA